MRAYFILGVICIVGAYASPTKKENSSVVLECVKESNFDMVTFARLVDGNFYVPPDDYHVPKEYYCLLSCIDDKRGKHQTYYEVLMHLVKTEVEDDIFSIGGIYTREDLENILNKCKSKELDECGFLECIEYRQSPFYEIHVDYFHY